METDLMALVGVWCAATLRSATPLIFVTLGESLGQRTGIINLGAEGEMLVGALAGFAVATQTDSASLGLLAGALAGGVLSLVHSALVLAARANQIASGLAVMIIGIGLTSYIGRAFVGKKVSSLDNLLPSGGEALAFFGPFLQQTTLAGPLAIAAAAFISWWINNTRSGLHWRSTGESAEVTLSNGINPIRIRFYAITVGGLLAGLGGAILSVDYTQTWAQEMTKGRGLIAVGLVIVAGWRPALVLPVCLFFGFTEAAVFKLQAMGITFSSHLLSTMPYVTVILVLIFAHLRARKSSQMPNDLKAVFQ